MLTTALLLLLAPQVSFGGGFAGRFGGPPASGLTVSAPASASIQTQYPDIPEEWLAGQGDSTGFPTPARKVQ